jgi:hypothetical protein
VYANIIEQGSLPPPVDWRPAEITRAVGEASGSNYVTYHVLLLPLT